MLSTRTCLQTCTWWRHLPDKRTTLCASAVSHNIGAVIPCAWARSHESPQLVPLGLLSEIASIAWPQAPLVLASAACSTAGHVECACEMFPCQVCLQVPALPQLPSNARYAFHSNNCFDWGTFGWAMQTQSLELSRYDYFIFLNSSVRGPFLPAYLRVRPEMSHLLPCLPHAALRRAARH